MTSESFRQRLGLDYLLRDSGQSTAQQSSAQQFIDAAMQATGFRVVSELRKSNGSGRLHDLVNKLSLDLPSLLKVSDYLKDKGLVDIVAVDQLGNNTIQLTQAGWQVPV